MNQSNKVYAFENGTRIDLSKIIAIGAIDKDENYNIILRVYCTGHNKPIIFILGNSIGSVSEENKTRIERVYSDFVGAWEYYLLLTGMNDRERMEHFINKAQNELGNG